MPDIDPEHAFEIGKKLRTARKSQKMSLRCLADKAEVSASFLSQIENGRAYPSVRSIYSIAAALALPVDYFFPDKHNGHVATEALVDNKSGEMTASELREAKSIQTSGEVTLEFGALSDSAFAPVVHPEARPTIELKGGVSWSRLTAQAEEAAEFLEILYAPGATSGTNMSHHEGREFGLVLEGELVIELGFERHRLHPGDSIIFDSTRPHRMMNSSTQPMRAIWVVLD